jgi:HlyD family secretion protein
MANFRKRRKLIVFSAIGLLILALALTAAFKKGDVVITVQTEKVELRSLTELVIANGRIQPVMQVTISPEVAGEIVALPVKEGSEVKKGDLLVQIKPDNYKASRNSAEASHKSALANRTVAKAELEKAEAEYKRNQQLFQNKLVSDSIFLEVKTAYDVAKLRYQTAEHQADQAKFGLDKAIDDLSKTTILSPIDGRVTRLQSQLGERVLGTSFNKGTEIMTVADLDEMEARVDIGESDVILIETGQKARLEVDAFKDRKFTGAVTEIANSSKGLGLTSGAMSGGGQSQDATKFEVRIRIQEKESFRPGMSISAEIETRSRTNVLTVPIASVTARLPKDTDKKEKIAKGGTTNSPAAATNSASVDGTNIFKADRKSKESPKPVDVVFLVDGDHAKMVTVKRGIADDDYWEITEGLKEGEEVISGGYKAINRELEDGKKIRKGMPGKDDNKDEK